MVSIMHTFIMSTDGKVRNTKGVKSKSLAGMCVCVLGPTLVAADLKGRCVTFTCVKC